MKASTDTILKAAIGLLMAVLIAVIADSFHQRVVQAGDKAPDFEITTDDGRKLTRTNFGGRVLVLNFWATWCPPCLDELPSLNELQKRLQGDGVVVLGISVDRNEKIYREFLNRVKVSFRTARDPEADISASYGTFKYPETYVINSSGVVVEKFIGPENWISDSVMSRIKRVS